MFLIRTLLRRCALVTSVVTWFKDKSVFAAYPEAAERGSTFTG